MKLQAELINVVNTLQPYEKEIKDHSKWLKENGDYNDFNTRLAWDCLNAFIGTETICSWYYKYNCNDKHITTLGIKALKELNVIL